MDKKLIDYAIIGGTSLGGLKNLKIENELEIETPFGLPSGKIKVGTIGSKQIAFINRHGNDGSIPPHCVNYRANLYALKMLNVQNIIALNAVGGIAARAVPMHIAVPNQLIDYSYGREHTFCDGIKRKGVDAIKFVDFTEPFSPALRLKLIEAGKACGIDKSHYGFSQVACYACTQGPRLESAAEVRKLDDDSCDLVGMTLMPEAGLARELNIPYASICLVVNWAAGKSAQPISFSDIEEAVRGGGHQIQGMLDKLFEMS